MVHVRIPGPIPLLNYVSEINEPYGTVATHSQALRDMIHVRIPVPIP